MGELLGAIPLGDVSIFGILALAIMLILTGRLVPRSTVDQIREDRDRALTISEKRGDDWKGVAETWQSIGQEQSGQLGQLLELAKTNDHLIRSIKERAEGPR